MKTNTTYIDFLQAENMFFSFNALFLGQFYAFWWTNFVEVALNLSYFDGLH